MTDKNNKRVLFVSHDATRTGAPIILLNFLRWLKAHHPEIKFDILLKKGGDLERDFSNIGKVYYWDKKNILIRILDKFIKWGEKRKRLINFLNLFSLVPKLKKNQYDLIYVNTLANSDIIPKLVQMINCKAICHVHELKMVTESFLDLQNVRAALPFFSCFIAVSEIVFSYLTKGLGIPPNKIEKIPGFINTPSLNSDKSGIRKKLGIGENTFVVCGSGTMDWRKAPDIFIQIASRVLHLSKKKDIFFIWVGGDLNLNYYKKLMHDVKMLCIEKSLRFTGNITDPLSLFAASDLFALTSREDPFPLVALEAGYLGLPIICFEGAVGSTEFVNEESGGVIPYLDVEGFSQSIIDFYFDREKLKKAKETIQKKTEVYLIDKIAPKILNIFNKNLK